VPLLVNEAKAKKYATNAGLTVITVPATIVVLYRQGVTSNNAAWRNTAAEIVGDAGQRYLRWKRERTTVVDVSRCRGLRQAKEFEDHPQADAVFEEIFEPIAASQTRL
jgi:hypothetical protein